MFSTIYIYIKLHREATTYWSACSIKNLTTNLPLSNQICLYNLPPSIFNTTSVCGDGLVEAGEQCDCGRAPSSECNSSCCSNVTCQLIGATTQCAFGQCCNVPTCLVGCDLHSNNINSSQHIIVYTLKLYTQNIYNKYY